MNQKKERYYLHGDAHESQPNSFYCALCDVFEDKHHFIEHNNPKDHLDKYSRSLEIVEIFGKKYPNRYYRPENTLNVLDDLNIRH